MAKHLLKYCERDWNWCFVHSCKSENKEMIEFFMNKGANNWNSALRYACITGNKEIVELILSKCNFFFIFFFLFFIFIFIFFF